MFLLQFDNNILDIIYIIKINNIFTMEEFEILDFHEL